MRKGTDATSSEKGEQVTGDRQPEPQDDDDPTGDSDLEKPTERGYAEDIKVDFEMEIEVRTKPKLFRLRLRVRQWDGRIPDGCGLFVNQTAVVISPVIVFAAWLGFDQPSETLWATGLAAATCLGAHLIKGRRRD